jgi:hypothetical protein
MLQQQWHRQMVQVHWPCKERINFGLALRPFGFAGFA